MDSLVRMHQTVRRWDSRTLHDCEEEVQKLPVHQLQRQEGDQSMQRSPLLAGIQVSLGHTPDSRVTNGWTVRLFSFHFCSIVCPVVLWMPGMSFVDTSWWVQAMWGSLNYVWPSSCTEMSSVSCLVLN